MENKCSIDQFFEFDNSKWLSAMHARTDGREYARMNVNGCNVKFLLDSGANINCICQKYIHRYQVTGQPHVINMWNHTQQTAMGEAVVDAINPRTKEVHSIKFTIIENEFQPILGVDTCKRMELFTINESKFVSVINESELGDLGVSNLIVEGNIPSKVLPCRKVPIEIQKDVTDALNTLVSRKMLIPVEKPTKWVSQMAAVRKPSGAIRICIDPQPLNLALQREHYKLPTFDDVVPKLVNAKVFTKLDVKEAYWHVRLDDESSLLTTMITPIGRFRWARLPFGLKVSSEIFQKRLHQALNDLEGVICVADDIVVFGCGNCQTEAESDHDKNLKRLIQRCKMQNIKLNEEKMSLKQSEIDFMGHKLSKDGIRASEEKVKAIFEMPAPENVSGVRRFCGMVQYLARFTPSLADDLEPIHKLTRKDIKFTWTQKCEKAFNKLKHKISNTPVLEYYDQSKTLVLQVDSSDKGLGAVLLQDGKPIEYASRNLRKNEQNWSQLEKETLAMVFGLERFDQYTYGRKVVIHNDHKPMTQILQKPLSQASRRVQSLMMRMFRYDYEFKWIKGEKLYLADTLSRAYREIEGDTPDLRICSVQPIEIPDSRLSEIKIATSRDELLQTVIKYINVGWPENSNEVIAEMKPYCNIRDTLAVENGIIYKGERAVIPKELQRDIKKRLHASHLGLESMLRRARETVYWPGMNTEVKQIAENCVQCQQFKPANQKEPLRQHDFANYPWEKVGCDLFTIESRVYLVVVDYKSNFIEVEYLRSAGTRTLIHAMEKMCARFGRPKVLISDGGPQFSSQEFRKFTKEWGITHVIASPYHQQSNGKAEAAVKQVKLMLKKCLREGTNQYLALLELRNTPRQDTASPAQILFGRNINTQLPSRNKRIEFNEERKARRQKSIVKSYNYNTKELPEIIPHQPVSWKSGPNDKVWKHGIVIERTGDRSYMIQGENGRTYIRNRIDLRPSEIKRCITDFDIPQFPEENIPEDPNPTLTMTKVSDQEVSDQVSVPVQNNSGLKTTESESSRESERPKRIRKRPGHLKDFVTPWNG